MHTRTEISTYRPSEATVPQRSVVRLRRVERVEELRAEAYEEGFSEGVAQGQTEQASRLRSLKEAARSKAERAFLEGRQQGAAEVGGVLQREQAHRLLQQHRVEEQRQQTNSLQTKLQRCATDCGGWSVSVNVRM